MAKKLLLCLPAFFVLLGCKGNPVVGNWSGNGSGGAMGLTFNADKTFQAKIGGNTIMNGTYEVEGKTVTMKATQMGAVNIGSGTSDSGQTATLSDDGKTLNMFGATFTKQ